MPPAAAGEPAVGAPGFVVDARVLGGRRREGEEPIINAQAGKSAVEPIPSGYPRLSPYLAVDNAAKAIDFYVDVLGATERMRMAGPDGKIGHAEVTFGENAVLMLSDEWPDMDIRGPRSIGGTPVTISVYVPDVDATYTRAVAAGATSLREPADQFYGDRSAQFLDPFGHRWNVMTHIEDVSAEEMERRVAEAMPESTS